MGINDENNEGFTPFHPTTSWGYTRKKACSLVYVMGNMLSMLYVYMYISYLVYDGDINRIT
jgi:hypothetical protein